MGPAYHRCFGLLQRRLHARDAAAAVCVLGLVALVVQIHHRGGGSAGSIMPRTSQMFAAAGANPSSAASCCRYVQPIPFVANRDAIGRLLEEEGMTAGVELGVQRGGYAETLLNEWTKCTKMTLVDAWARLENYADIANVPDDEQEELFQEAQSRLNKFKARGTELEFLRMLTADAAAKIPDGSVDFIYVDARHDHCGALEDIEAYWPKLKEGGLMAGHDYVLKETWEALGQDWTLCGDGRHKPLAVLGAVNDFAARHDLQVVVPPFDDEWKSWIVRKPSIRCGPASSGGAQAVDS